MLALLNNDIPLALLCTEIGKCQGLMRSHMTVPLLFGLSRGKMIITLTIYYMVATLHFLVALKLDHSRFLCPLHGSILLTPHFRKDLVWFAEFLPITNGVFLLQAEVWTSLPLYIDACTPGDGGGGCLLDEMYHTPFPPTRLVSRSVTLKRSILSSPSLTGLISCKGASPSVL